jgi:hypothetical protein
MVGRSEGYNPAGIATPITGRRGGERALPSSCAADGGGDEEPRGPAVRDRLRGDRSPVETLRISAEKTRIAKKN